MGKEKLVKGLMTVSSMILLGACAGGTSDSSGNGDSSQSSMPEVMSSEMNSMSSGSSMAEMEGMEHDDSGELPEGLREAADPAYVAGETVTLLEGHMDGMKGAEATIVGAFATTAYEVSYDPTTGGERVENHKWVIQEEIADAGEEVLQPGTEVVLEADHMAGMQGAAAVIEEAETTTVYMIDYTPTDGGEKVVNHKWVTEDELSPAEE